MIVIMVMAVDTLVFCARELITKLRATGFAVLTSTPLGIPGSDPRGRHQFIQIVAVAGRAFERRGERGQHQELELISAGGALVFKYRHDPVSLSSDGVNVVRASHFSDRLHNLD